MAKRSLGRIGPHVSICASLLAHINSLNSPNASRFLSSQGSAREREINLRNGNKSKGRRGRKPKK